MSCEVHSSQLKNILDDVNVTLLTYSTLTVQPITGYDTQQDTFVVMTILPWIKVVEFTWKMHQPLHQQGNNDADFIPS